MSSSFLLFLSYCSDLVRVRMPEVPSRIILSLVDRIIQNGKIQESASLVKAYLWRGRDVVDLVSERGETGRGSTQP